MEAELEVDLAAVKAVMLPEAVQEDMAVVMPAAMVTEVKASVRNLAEAVVEDPVARPLTEADLAEALMVVIQNLIMADTADILPAVSHHITEAVVEEVEEARHLQVLPLQVSLQRAEVEAQDATVLVVELLQHP